MATDSYVPLQVEYLSSPWRVLVVCALLNLTSRDQVRPVLDELFTRWPNPSSLAAAGPELEDLLHPLGLAEQRARRLRRMSGEFDQVVFLCPFTIERLHACGTYSGEAFRVFCQGDLLGRPPADRVLRAYVEANRA